MPSPEGTLWDTLVGGTDPATVAFQMDLFHAYHGGADLIPVIEKLKGRVPSLHLKDLKKGFPVEPGSPAAPAEADVPVGTGQIDYPAVLRAAIKAGAPPTTWRTRAKTRSPASRRAWRTSRG